MNSTESLVARLMSGNVRTIAGHSFTVPSPVRYPFQWLWDSCFHAFIYTALNDPASAEKELLSAVAQQHASGLVPHINFWHDATAPLPNWGRELRGKDLNHIFSLTGSNLTQPPLLARAVYETYKNGHNRTFLEEIYPKVVQFFLYLHQNRNYKETSLLYIINPDESGEDNSPRFDNSLGLASQHSASASLDKRINLMQQLVECDFDTKRCMQKYFAVVDVGFNCIYIDGLKHLAELALVLGKTEDSEIFTKRSKDVTGAMHKHLTKDDI